MLLRGALLLLGLLLRQVLLGLPVLLGPIWLGVLVTVPVRAVVRVNVLARHALAAAALAAAAFASALSGVWMTASVRSGRWRGRGWLFTHCGRSVQVGRAGRKLGKIAARLCWPVRLCSQRPCPSDAGA